MKAFVFLLVLGNVLFYAFGAGYFGQSERPDAGRLNQQVSPERMRIVSRGEPPALPAGKAPEPVASEVTAEKPEAESPEVKPVPPAKVVSGDDCVAWNRLSLGDVERVGTTLAGKFGDFKWVRKPINGDGASWLVYIPPMADKAEADKKAGELRDLGVTDFFPIQDGPNRFAISLGIFSAEKGAQERLADLKSRGVRSARTSVRPGKEGYLRLEATGPAANRAALVAAMAKVIGKNDALSCK